MQLKSKPAEHQHDEVSASRRTVLKYVLTAAVATSMAGKALAEAVSTIKTSKELSIENFSTAGKFCPFMGLQIGIFWVLRAT